MQIKLDRWEAAELLKKHFSKEGYGDNVYVELIPPAASKITSTNKVELIKFIRTFAEEISRGTVTLRPHPEVGIGLAAAKTYVEKYFGWQ
jgi:hypothetical protein